MNRRRFVRGLAEGTAVALSAASARAVNPPSPAASSDASGTVPPKPPLVTTPLVVQAPRVDGFEAAWGVSELSRGCIEWESEPDDKGVAAMDRHGFVPQGNRFVRVRVSGLRPGVRYRIRSVTTTADGARSEVSDWRVFRTLDANASVSRFAVWNDTHMNDETLRRLDEVTPPSDFLIWNGDVCNDWHREDLLLPTLFQPAGRDITRERPMMVVCGNHDVRGLHAFRMPDLVASPEGRPFFAFRSGPVAVVCLHTGEDKPDTHPSFGGRVAFDTLRQEQTRWLESALSRPELSTAPYRVVFCHIPLRWLDERLPDYSNSGFDRYSRRSRDAWQDLLVRWKAQVVISGHTHHSAWIAPTDTFPYGQLVGGGPSPKAATWIVGDATPKRLQLVMRKLDGAIDQEVTLEPLT